MKRRASTSTRKRSSSYSKRPKRAPARTGRTRVIGNYGRYNQPSKAHNEIKYHDLTLGSGVIGGTTIYPATGTLNLIAQGTGPNQRIGRKVTVTSIHFRGYVDNTISTAASGFMMRVILYLDKQCNGAAAAGNDLLVDSTILDSYRNLDNSGRFTFLYDKVMTLNPSIAYDSVAAGLANAVTIRRIAINKKVSIPIEFSAAVPTIADIKSNNLCFLLIPEPISKGSFVGQFRLRYSDN